MNTYALQNFADYILANGRIGLADVRRLQRDLLPAGIASRDEAELLIALDRATGCTDPAWADWLVSVVVDFVVWGERPTGYVDPATAGWLTAVLQAGGKGTRTARLIAREIAREAQGTDERLIAFAHGSCGAPGSAGANRLPLAA